MTARQSGCSRLYNVNANAYIFSETFLLVSSAAIAGNIGWKALAAYPAEWVSGQYVTMKGRFVMKLGVRPFFGSLGRVEVDLEDDY